MARNALQYNLIKVLQFHSDFDFHRCVCVNEWRMCVMRVRDDRKWHAMFVWHGIKCTLHFQYMHIDEIWVEDWGLEIILIVAYSKWDSAMVEAIILLISRFWFSRSLHSWTMKKTNIFLNSRHFGNIIHCMLNYLEHLKCWRIKFPMSTLFNYSFFAW